MIRVSKEDFRRNLPSIALTLVGGLAVAFGASRGVSADSNSLLPDLAPHRLTACWTLNPDDPNFVDVGLHAEEINLGGGGAGVHGAVVKVLSWDSPHMWRGYPVVSSLGPGETAVLEDRLVVGRSFGGYGWTLPGAREGNLHAELAVDAYGVGVPESDEGNNSQTIDSIAPCSAPGFKTYFPSISN